MKACLLSLTFSLLLAATAAAQGDLNPPGPPAPTLKTLAQVEPRIDLATVAGGSNSEAEIRKPGSYYLSRDLEVTKGIGIFVFAPGVTIDLNGFRIVRVGGEFNSGVFLNPISNGCVVKNGTIDGFHIGVNSQIVLQNGQPTTSRGATLADLTISNCFANGVLAGVDWQIERCKVYGSGIGLSTGEGAIIRDCIVVGNSGIGIQAGGRSVVSNCNVSRNGGDGLRLLASVFAFNNFCEANGQETSSSGAAIRAYSKSRLQNNTCLGNDRGIVLEGIGNLVDGNLIRDSSGPGIEVKVPNGKNVVIRNIAGDNVGSYTGIAAGNDVGPIGSVTASTHPLANVQN